MSDPQSNGDGTGPRRRRGKRFLSPGEKYEIGLSFIKADWPRLDAIRDPAVLRAELATVRHQ